MESEKLTPLESLQIITESIHSARYRIEGNGKVYAFWGLLVSIASFGQFYLLQKEMYDINFYPYFLMPLGVVYTWYYFKKKQEGPLNQISKIVRTVWIVVSFNMIVLGFFFYPFLTNNLIPVLMLILAIGYIISGITIKSKVIMFAGILVNIMGFACFYLDWQYHSLLMGFMGIIAMFLPGLYLMKQQKK